MKGLIAQGGNGFLPGHFSFPNVFKTVVMNIITVKNVRDVIVIIPRCIKTDMSLRAIAIGNNATASGMCSTAVGYNAKAQRQ